MDHEITIRHLCGGWWGRLVAMLGAKNLRTAGHEPAEAVQPADQTIEAMR